MTVRSLVAVATLATCTAGAAMAADLPMRSAPPAPYVAPLPVFTWTGFYAGINGGYAFTGDTRFRSAGLNGRVNDDGFTAGGQIGYNFQVPGFGVGGSGLVMGVEADAAYTDLGKNTNVAGFGTLHGGLDYLGTVRGRVGYAFNNFMIYGTGGFAYGDVNDSVNGAGFSGGRSRTATGYAYGGGIEYALPTNTFLNFFHSSAVTLKAEYLHYDLGSTTFDVANGASTFSTRARNDGDLARVGLNYKF